MKSEFNRQIERKVDYMEKTVNLLVNHYIGDDFHPSRQVTFVIAEECLKDYLTATEDDRTIE